MRTLARFVIGTLLAFSLVWLSALAYSLLIRYLPVSPFWWGAHKPVLYTVEILTFVPFAAVIALLSRRIFPRHAVAGAFACTFAAMAALLVPMAGSFDVLLASVKINAEFIVAFVVGVPLIGVVLRRRAGPFAGAPSQG